MFDMPGAQPLTSLYIAVRIELSRPRSSESPNRVPWVGSVLDGACASWVWIVEIAEL